MKTVEVDLGYLPHKFQLEIHHAMARHRFSVVVTHRRFGKTVLAVAALIDAALSCSRPNPRVGYVAPLLKQAKQTAWSYVVEMSSKIPGTRIRESELTVEFPNGASLHLYGGSEGNEEAMRGIYLDAVVIDEYAGISPTAFDQVILPTLADRHGWALVIGTPKGMDSFYRLYHEEAPRRGWYRAIYRIDETVGVEHALEPGLPQLSWDEVRQIQANSMAIGWRQEWLCDFGAEAEDALISIDVISTASGKLYAPQDISLAPMVLGVDVARFGGDRSVLQRRQGLHAYEPVVFHSIDNMALAGHVATEIDRHNVQACFVDAGRGEGVIDRLRQLGYRVTEVNFGGKPLDDHYADKRTEMWVELKRWLEAGGSIPNTSDLKTDLAGPRYEFTAAGKLRLEPKDKMRERGMRSTDLGDALALTFAQRVAPAALRRPGPVQAIREYA